LRTFATNFGDAGLTNAGFDALATLPNGDILAAGTTTGGAAVLALFDSTGSVVADTFASSGMSQIRALTVQPDGSGYAIIAAGVDLTSGDFGLARYTLDGTEWEADSTFAGNFSSPFTGASFRPDQLAVGGVREIVSPTTTLSFLSARPSAFLACKVTTKCAGYIYLFAGP
jgi:hypothetical protein